jgi:hypothetical protein
MVYYFTSTSVDPPAFIYVGKDKFESRSAFLDTEIRTLLIDNSVLGGYS